MNLSAWLFSIPRFVAAVAIALCLFPYGAGSRTIRVERDGSGDFATLQPALDAAAAGDTVLIGPGEYPELTTQYLPDNGGWVDVVGYIKSPGIVLIGAGMDSTILGPSSFVPGSIGLAFIILGDLSLEGLTVRNAYDGLHVDSGRIFVNRCNFFGNDAGILWYSTDAGGGVWDSHFESDILYSTGILLLGTGTDVQIEGCTFDGCSMKFQGLHGVVVENCESYNGNLGAQLQSGASVQFVNCLIYGKTGVGIGLVPGNCHAMISDCEISAGVDAVFAYGAGNSFSIRNSILTGGSRSIAYLEGIGSSSIQFCELRRGAGDYSVLCSQHFSTGGVTHDLRGNFWGTTDPDQIAEWIWDGHDDPVWAYAEVLYTPFATGDSDLVVSLAPQDSTIIIPETGGSFLYDASIENNTGADIVADLTIEAVLPDGTAYPVMTLPGVTLAGASVRTRIGIVQEVPGAAPAGTYTYRVMASLGDTLLVDTAELPFEKQGGAVAAAGAMSWPVTGWLDDDRPPFQAGAVKPVLHGPVPNPFNPTTTVAFELPTQEAVSLHVFDLQGRLVRTLLRSEVVPQGRHEAKWDGRDASGRQAASGTYFFRLEAGGQIETKRAVLVK